MRSNSEGETRRRVNDSRDSREPASRDGKPKADTISSQLIAIETGEDRVYAVGHPPDRGTDAGPPLAQRDQLRLALAIQCQSRGLELMVLVLTDIGRRGSHSRASGIHVDTLAALGSDPGPGPGQLGAGLDVAQAAARPDIRAGVREHWSLAGQVWARQRGTTRLVRRLYRPVEARLRQGAGPLSVVAAHAW